MTDLKNEADFFNEIAPRIHDLVSGFDGKASVSIQKGMGDFATEVDIAVEDFIVEEIRKRFPGDLILAEEGHSDTAIPDGRIWIIDPICGTSNLGRGIKSFCSNIALADKGKLIASCVVDHSQNDYFWSVGGNNVYINDRLFQYTKPRDDFGVLLDVDLGALGTEDKTLEERYSAALRVLLTETDYMFISLGSSLGFAYTAVGKLDGFMNVANNPWDICASVFLLQQSGGVVSDIDGASWSIASQGAIGARNSDIHRKLVDSLSLN